MSGARKPGPDPKGERAAFTVRIPEEHKDHLDEAAREAGLRRSDYCALLIAQALELPEPAYIDRPRLKQQGELPIGA